MEKSKFNPEKVGRKSGEHHPSLWGDYFITCNPTFSSQQKLWMEQKVEELKEVVKEKLRSTTDLHESMSLIDAIQHLGIDYHFEEEIDKALDCLYNSELECFDLHEVALRFRLLRQHGFRVSADEFTKFKDDKGNFTETLRNDPRGLLSLYNAAYLGTRGENILEEAISFARIHLESIANNLKPPLANQVSRALVTPLSRSVKRLETRYYISDYEMEDKRDDTIFELAKLDFNLLQTLHREELKSISLWWKDFELEDKLCYVRDRIVELYFWILGVYFEPHYSRARMIATKAISFVCILDDTYDVYGTLEECRLLTDAIQRWDTKSVDQMPTYLKHLFLKLVKTFKEFEDELASEDKYRVSYLREMVNYSFCLSLINY
ncbi:alpha-humulene synthase-like [Ananas comosus]|uniref:Alpha-humulene synthase-like n=1 Tax=Ananas comosus TaxID=4615 RepID=A0A6P5GWU8_ANACO|nr:alpha-humulene synthase-like [Ananas comosus]